MESYPIFIVGMPRSGTKLLRSILIRNYDINIPEIETEFLPLWHNKWPHYGDLSKKCQFKKFYDIVIKLPFFLYQKDEQNLVEMEEWYQECTSYSLADVFQALILLSTPSDKRNSKVWGDKSPSYIRNIELINTIYPNAKFIHIVRDVRDYCLSINKAWGKNKIRAAQRWSDDVAHAQHSLSKIENSIEVKYEDLLSNTKLVLNEICSFLEVQYSDSMIEHIISTENIGDAKGYVGIKKDNKNKYKRIMNRNEQRLIEGIAYTTMRKYGYVVEIAKHPTRINKFKNIIYLILDGFSLYRYESKERGWIKGIIFHTRYYFSSGNRAHR
ncbi:MAG: sulfotransferase [Candidatus Thiodiazotropha sp. (ex Lucinoma borealis)]|nr:sulfotransferase [Candidatus Thiodiazotropha sp. (ex Lucinoma borealis)]